MSSSTNNTNNNDDDNEEELTPTPPTNANNDESGGNPSSSGIQIESGGGNNISSRGGGGIGNQSAINSPLLNGENIVLLSLSNDNTPNESSSNTSSAARMLVTGFDEIERGVMSMTSAASTANTNNFISEGSLLLSSSSSRRINLEAAYSPPPDSIQTAELPSLSPPLLSSRLKSSDGRHHHHHPYYDEDNINGGGGGGGSIISGSQSLFSGNNGGGSAAGAGGGGAGLYYDGIAASSSKQQKQRPPLPPRWAIGTTTGNVVVVAAPSQSGEQHHHHHHPLPPKQVGPPLSHRRVLSTGDASIMSVLTDPDSGLDGGGSSPVPPTTVTTTTTLTLHNEKNNIVSSSSSRSSILPVVVPAINRKRGVSWEDPMQHGGGGGGGGGGQQVTTSTSQFSTEEQAAFDTLGILQPILGGGGGGGGGGFEDLMQPILDDNGAATTGDDDGTTAVIDILHPPLPPENVLPLKSSLTTPLPTTTTTKSSLLHNNKPTTTSSSHRAGLEKSKRSQNMTSITQFEDEANLAIMEALNRYNLEQSEILGASRQQQQQQQQQVKQEEEEEEGETVDEDDKDEEDDLVGGVPHHVVRPTPTHRNDVSGITLSDGLDRSPAHRPAAASLGIHTFEDVAWHEGYDAQGRIDGTLNEERESKYIEEELGIDLNAGSKLGVAMKDDGLEGAAVQPPSVSGSDQESQKSKGTTVSWASKGSKPSTAIANKATSPNKTGLRHRRTGTRGGDVLSAAQELAAMATIDESDESESSKGHSRIISSADRHGIGNLLDGASLLFAQQEKIEGTGSADDESMPFIAEETSVDMQNETDPPRDEETGDANPNAKRHTRTPTNLFGMRQKPTKKDRHLERQFRMKLWYDDLIAPRLPSFIKTATHSFLFVMVPLLLLAIILYYGTGNPMTAGAKRIEQLTATGKFQGSWSWWVLFILRQFFVFSCVTAGEVLFIDIIALRTPIFVKVFGSFATLMFVQARGWPYVVTFWGICE